MKAGCSCKDLWNRNLCGQVQGKPSAGGKKCLDAAISSRKPFPPQASHMMLSVSCKLELRTPGNSYQHSVAGRYEARSAHSLPHSEQQHVVKALPAKSILLPHNCLSKQAFAQVLPCRPHGSEAAGLHEYNKKRAACLRRTRFALHALSAARCSAALIIVT